MALQTEITFRRLQEPEQLSEWARLLIEDLNRHMRSISIQANAVPSSAGDADTLDGLDSTDFSLVGHSHIISSLSGQLGADRVSTGIVSNTEYNYLDGLTANIQFQLDSKLTRGSIPMPMDGEDGEPGWPGPIGPRGEQGLQGLPGFGIDGEDGEQGTPGIAGLAGATGATGSIGTTGERGPIGLAGEDGEDGLIGPPGIQGLTGETGATGTAGSTGATGLPGLMGIPGVDGDDGEIGIPGIQGPIGTTGAAGSVGATGVTGAAGIPGLPGADGDEGEPGPIGPIGLTGATGATGTTGSTGATGAAGAQGLMGPVGSDGEDGEMGLQGPIGLTGIAGPVGIPGADGEDADTGFVSGNADSNLFTRLGGRGGTANDTILSLTSDGTLYGSAMPGADLYLYANTSRTEAFYHPVSNLRALYDGFVKFPYASLQILAPDPRVGDTTGTTALNLYGVVGGIFVGANSQIINMRRSLTPQGFGTITGTYDDPELLGMTSDDNQQLIFWNDSRAGEAVTWSGFAFIIKNNLNSARRISTQVAAVNSSTVSVDGGTLTINGAGCLGLLYTPTFNQFASAGAGSFDSAQDAVAAAVLCNGSINTGWTLRGYYGLKFNKPSGSGGSVTEMAAVHVADISDARFTAYSLISNGSTVAMVHKGPIAGGTASGANLTLYSTTNATKGTITFQPDLASVTSDLNVLTFNATIAMAGTSPIFHAIDFSPTLTISSSIVPQISVLTASGTYTSTVAPVVGLYQLFSAGPTIQSNTASVPPLSPVIYNSACTVKAGANIGAAGVNCYAFQENNTVSVTAAGTMTLTDLVGLYSATTISQTAGGTLTVTNRRAVWVRDPAITGTPTLTNNIALDVDALTKGGTLNVAVRSAITAASTSYFLRDTGGAQSYLTGKFTTYNGVATAGVGLAAIYGETIDTTRTANATILTYTPPATAGRYRVGVVITTTSSTNTGTLQATIDYKDSQGTTHSGDIIPICGAAGTVAASQTSVASKEFHAGPYHFSINNAATAIVVKVVITGTVSYTTAASVEQLA